MNYSQPFVKHVCRRLQAQSLCAARGSSVALNLYMVTEVNMAHIYNTTMLILTMTILHYEISGKWCVGTCVQRWQCDDGGIQGLKINQH